MELNNPFVFNDGTSITTPDDWSRRRAEILDLIVQTEYGGLPPEPAAVRPERLHTNKPRQFPESTYTQYRVVLEEHPAFHFRLDVMVPPVQGDERVPCVLSGDGCYRYVTDDLLHEMMERKVACAIFSRTAIVPDVYSNERVTGLYDVYPDRTYGALAAWAWGFHRAVDVLIELDGIDPDAIAATGHSRGGKTALLAGATDERIALTAPNGSGSGGAGCYKFQGPESETLADTKRMIPYWFGPDLWQYVDRVDEMPFDQHFLKALVAPRALISTEGLDDLWSNPSGTYQSHLAAREVYRFLGAENRIGIRYRTGGHDHSTDDWHAFLDFLDWQFRGIAPRHPFDENPYPDMGRAFSWTAPDSTSMRGHRAGTADE